MAKTDLFSLWQTEFDEFKTFYNSLTGKLEKTISDFQKYRHKIEVSHDEKIDALQKNSAKRDIDLKNKLVSDLADSEKKFKSAWAKIERDKPTKDDSIERTSQFKEEGEKALDIEYADKMLALSADNSNKKKEAKSDEELTELQTQFTIKKQLLTNWYKESVVNLSAKTEKEVTRLKNDFENKVKRAHLNFDRLQTQFKTEQSQINLDIIKLSTENWETNNLKKQEIQAAFRKDLHHWNLNLESQLSGIKNEFEDKRAKLLAIEYLLEKECTDRNYTKNQRSVILEIATISDRFSFSSDLNRGSLNFEIQAKLFYQFYPPSKDNSTNVLVLYSEKERANAIRILSNLSGGFLSYFDPTNLQLIVGAKAAEDIPTELYNLKINTKLSHPFPNEFAAHLDSLKSEIIHIMTQLHASKKKDVQQFNNESEKANLNRNILLLYDVALRDYNSHLETIKYLVGNSRKSDLSCLLGFNKDSYSKDAKEKAEQVELLHFIAKNSLVIDCSITDMGVTSFDHYKLSEKTIIRQNDINTNLETITQQLNASIEEIKQKNLLPITDYLKFSEENWKRNSSLREITFTVGNYINTKREARLTLSGSVSDTEFPHIRIEAPSGSGKSSFLDILIISIALNYSPDQVQFYFIDKTGTAFGKFIYTIPHVKFAAVRAGIEEVNNVFELLFIEYNNRINMFSQLNIDEFKELGENNKVPRIIVFVDEFSELWKENHEEFQRNFLSALTQFRKAGIHIVCVGSVLPMKTEFNSLQTLNLLDLESTKTLFGNSIKHRAGRLLVGGFLRKKIEDVIDCYASKWEENKVEVSGIKELLPSIPFDREKYAATILDYRIPLLIQDYPISEKITIGKTANDETIHFDLFEKRQKNNLVITGGEADQREDFISTILYQLKKQKIRKIQIHSLYCPREKASFEFDTHFSFMRYDTIAEVEAIVNLIKTETLDSAFEEHIFVIYNIENNYENFMHSFIDSESVTNVDKAENLFAEILQIYPSRSNIRFIIESDRMENIERIYNGPNSTEYMQFRNMVHVYSQHFVIFKSDKKEIDKIIGNSRNQLKNEDRIIFYNRSSGTTTYLRPYKFSKNEE